jgi:hypothetical protein
MRKRVTKKGVAEERKKGTSLTRLCGVRERLVRVDDGASAGKERSREEDRGEESRGKHGQAFCEGA